MREDFVKILTAEIERHVDVAFEVRRMMAGVEEKRFARLPYLNDPYEPECETLIPHYQRQVCAALAAREWFRQHAPPWAPELPLSSADIVKLISSKSPARSSAFLPPRWLLAIGTTKSIPPFTFRLRV